MNNHYEELCKSSSSLMDTISGDIRDTNSVTIESIDVEKRYGRYGYSFTPIHYILYRVETPSGPFTTRCVDFALMLAQKITQRGGDVKITGYRFDSIEQLSITSNDIYPRYK